MFGKSWNKADEQKELISIGICCNSKKKPSAITSNVISAAINIPEKDFFRLFLHPSSINLLSLELEINLENENVCYNYFQHNYLWYSQNYMIIPYWKSSCVYLLLKSQTTKFLYASIYSL